MSLLDAFIIGFSIVFGLLLALSFSGVVPILGIWEVVIGITMIIKPLIRVSIILLFIQMPGTFLPLVLFPEVCFTSFPFGLTLEGQYIVKNLIIISAALVVGSTVRK